tara:strand:- start:256 stop:492 length:237 start_codon:yes stop_codon:yes gene_type:complete
MKERKDGTSPYYTNKAVKAKIDRLLQMNSIIWSNIGTNSTTDCKTRKKGEEIWHSLSNQIKELDEKFYNVVCPHGIDS